MSKAISERAPRGLSIHLREIETSIIFELSWVKGSPLYSYLQVLHLHDKSSVTSSNDQSEEELEFEEPSEASSNSEGFMKTKSIEQDELKTPERTQFIPNEENQSQVLVPMPKLARPPTLDRSLNVFFKRFLFLLGERAYLLSDSLQIDDFHKEQLWVVLKQIICEETSLIENNTIDHILVCTLFAKCKMMTSSRTFQEILDSYKKLAFVRQDLNILTFKDAAEETHMMSLKDFYNLYFIPRVKKYIAPSSEQPSLGKDQLLLHTPEKAVSATERLLTRLGLESPLKETVRSMVQEKEIRSVPISKFSGLNSMARFRNKAVLQRSQETELLMPAMLRPAEKKTEPIEEEMEPGVKEEDNLPSPTPREMKPSFDFISQESISLLQQKMNPEKSSK